VVGVELARDADVVGEEAAPGDGEALAVETVVAVDEPDPDGGGGTNPPPPPPLLLLAWEFPPPPVWPIPIPRRIATNTATPSCHVCHERRSLIPRLPDCSQDGSIPARVKHPPVNNRWPVRELTCVRFWCCG
jgi:hypothetical protein